MFKFIYIFMAAVSFSACTNIKLSQYSVIQGLRILGIVADSPELLYDGTTFTPNSINITPIISDLYGGGRTLKYNLEWCLDPGVSLGATPTCFNNPTRTIVASDQTVNATATFLTPNYTGNADPIATDFSLGSAAAQAIISAKFLASSSSVKFNGISLLVMYELYVSGNASSKIIAFKRIVISAATKATKNSNPTGLEVRQNGTEITALPSINATLEAYLPSTQAETYSVMDSSGTVSTKSEILETTWFLTGPEEVECSNKKDCTTDGLFSLTRTKLGEYNSFFAPLLATPTARGRVLITVARDGRGGIMSKRYCTGTCP